MARDWLDRWRNSLDNAVDAARKRLPEFSLASDIEVPVYIVHQGPGPEDYELLCDFESFMRESQSGLLHRPKLRVWAGRDDFDRSQFARNLREAFSCQFDLAREALRAEREAKSTNRFWELSSLADLLIWGVRETTGLVGALLLYLAVVAGGQAVIDILARLKAAAARVGGSRGAEADLAELIAEKKSIIDEGLARLSVTLHRDLYVHAWRGQCPGPMTGMDRNAWPLPVFVRARMDH